MHVYRRVLYVQYAHCVGVMRTDRWLSDSTVVGAHFAYASLRCGSLHSLRGRPLPHKRPTLRWPLFDTSCRLLPGDVLQHGPCVVVEDVLEGLVPQGVDEGAAVKDLEVCTSFLLHFNFNFFD